MARLQELGGQYSVFIPKAIAQAMQISKGMEVKFDIKTNRHLCLRFDNNKQEATKK